MDSKDPINDFLDLVPLQDGSHGVPTASNPEVSPTAAHSDVFDHADDDFEEARETIDELLEQGLDALKEFRQIASQSQHPRAFEVFSTMLKTMQDLSVAKLDAAEKRRKAKGMDKKGASEGNENVGGNKTVNNTVFIGSTAALAKYLDENPQITDQSTQSDDE